MDSTIIAIEKHSQYVSRNPVHAGRLLLPASVFCRETGGAALRTIDPIPT
jgi:hypothetical protein